MSERDAIEKVFTDYCNACNDDDVPKFLATLTEDAQVLAPGMPKANGKSAAERLASTSYFGPFRMKLCMTNDEVEVWGDAAYANGHYTLTLAPRDGSAPIEDRGKYLDILRRDGDGWKFSHLCWNNDSSGERRSNTTSRFASMPSESRSS